MENKSRKGVGGRKSKYSTHVEHRFDEIRVWRQEGQTEENIAKLLGISYRTLADYKLKYPQFMQVLKESKETLVTELENTMFQLALGKIKVKKSKKTYIRNIKGQMVLDKEEVNEDEVAPNPTMLIFSLKNLASDRWQDKREVVTTNEDDKLVDSIDNLIDTLRK